MMWVSTFRGLVLATLTFSLGAPAARAQSLFELPPGVETRWASPENRSGLRVRGASAGGGRKGPVYFRREIRITMQQIGYLADHSRGPFVRMGAQLVRAGEGDVPMDISKDGKFERSDDWSSCAYFYLDRPENGRPPLAPAGSRIAGL